MSSMIPWKTRTKQHFMRPLNFNKSMSIDLYLFLEINFASIWAFHTIPGAKGLIPLPKKSKKKSFCFGYLCSIGFLSPYYM